MIALAEKGENIFDVASDVKVNTVNCRGVMGAGLALAFRQRYPEMFAEYRAICEDKQLEPGRLHVFQAADCLIINLPTKRNYRKPSRYEYVEAGLLALREWLDDHPGKSVCLPALGCRNGKLCWDRVWPMICELLDGVDAQVIVFPPDSVIA